jgi:hypothetical protein
MPISDLISTSFLFSIAIIIILIGGIFAYVSYRMSEQDHKLTSMLGLVSTLAEEMHSLKGRLNDSIVLKDGDEGDEDEGDEGEVDDDSSRKEIHIFDQNMLSGGTDINLISVSDNESESESESEDSESESSNDSESESESESDSESSDSDSLLVSNVKILNISHDNISHDNEFKEDLEEEDSFIPESFVHDFTEESLIEELAELAELTELAEELVENLDTKLIHLAEPIELVSDSMLDISELKNIMISDKPDYKKMGLNKLREVVVERNILSAVEAGKLKKPELLKLIEDL